MTHPASPPVDDTMSQLEFKVVSLTVLVLLYCIFLIGAFFLASWFYFVGWFVRLPFLHLIQYQEDQWKPWFEEFNKLATQMQLLSLEDESTAVEEKSKTPTPPPPPPPPPPTLGSSSSATDSSADPQLERGTTNGDSKGVAKDDKPTNGTSEPPEEGMKKVKSDQSTSQSAPGSNSGNIPTKRKTAGDTSISVEKKLKSLASKLPTPPSAPSAPGPSSSATGSSANPPLKGDATEDESNGVVKDDEPTNSASGHPEKEIKKGKFDQSTSTSTSKPIPDKTPKKRKAGVDTPMKSKDQDESSTKLRPRRGSTL